MEVWLEEDEGGEVSGTHGRKPDREVDHG